MHCWIISFSSSSRARSRTILFQAIRWSKNFCRSFWSSTIRMSSADSASCAPTSTQASSNSSSVFWLPYIILRATSELYDCPYTYSDSSE